MNLNKVYLIGRLTQNPEVKTTSSGQMVCTFGLATNRTWTNPTSGQKQEKAEYHNIVLWRRLAEIASQYLKKGSLTLIEGRIQTRSWNDPSGNKRYKTEIIAENIQLGPRTNFRETSDDTISLGEPPNRNNPADDIPIIEEESAHAANEPLQGEPPFAKAPKDEEEIDVKDIPF
jgi:single-strand DNA-binding protein